MQSEFALTPQSIKKEACHFISLDVAMSCCTIFKVHDVHSGVFL